MKPRPPPASEPTIDEKKDSSILKRIRFRSVAPTDITQCLEIERASYPPNETASKNTLQYRQHHAAPYFRCAVLRYNEEDDDDMDDVDDDPESETIVGFICSTRCKADRTEDTLSTHIATGPILAIHSVVVRSEYRRQGLASAMLRDYITTIYDLNKYQIKQFQMDAQKALQKKRQQHQQQQQQQQNQHHHHQHQASTSSIQTTSSTDRIMTSTGGSSGGTTTTSLPPTGAAIITKLVLISKSDLLTFYVDCGFSVIRPSTSRLPTWGSGGGSSIGSSGDYTTTKKTSSSSSSSSSTSNNKEQSKQQQSKQQSKQQQQASSSSSSFSNSNSNNRWYDLEMILKEPNENGGYGGDGNNNDDDDIVLDQDGNIIDTMVLEDDGWDSDWLPQIPFQPMIMTPNSSSSHRTSTTTSTSTSTSAAAAAAAGIPCFMVDAFATSTTTPGTGNPAAVVILPSSTTFGPTLENWCQIIAAEFNLAETAFCWPRINTITNNNNNNNNSILQQQQPPRESSGSGSSSSINNELHWNIRYFTPKVEVPLCGHATLASAAILYQTIPYAKLTNKRIVFHAKEDQLVMQYAKPIVAAPAAVDMSPVPSSSSNNNNNNNGNDPIGKEQQQQRQDDDEKITTTTTTKKDLPPSNKVLELAKTTIAVPNNSNANLPTTPRGSGNGGIPSTPPRNVSGGSSGGGGSGDSVQPVVLKKSSSGDGMVGGTISGSISTISGEARLRAHARAQSLMTPLSSDALMMTAAATSGSGSGSSSLYIGGSGGGDAMMMNRPRTNSRGYLSNSSLAFAGSFETTASGTSGGGGGPGPGGSNKNSTTKPDKLGSVLTTKISMEFPAKPATELTTREELSAVHKMLESTFSCTLDALYVGISEIGDVLVELTPKSFHEIGYECLNYKALLEWDGYYRGVIVCCACPDSKLQQQIIQQPHHRQTPSRTTSMGSNKSDKVIMGGAEGAASGTSTTGNGATSNEAGTSNSKSNNTINGSNNVNVVPLKSSPPPVIASPDFLSRFFGPKAGINEDPVTGSAHCVLGPYFAKKLNKNELIGKQMSERGGIVECEVTPDKVILTGSAVITMSGTVWL